MKRNPWIRHRPWVLTAIFLLAGANALQGADSGAPWLGVLWTQGPVSVGDALVSSGTTVLPGDVITTAQGASAWLRFRSPASTILQSNTQVAVFSGDSDPGILLRRGTVVVDEKLADPFQITVPGGLVLIQADPQTGAECETAAVENGVSVSVRRGLAEIQGQGAPVLLHPGESVRVQADPQGGPQVAGKIAKVVSQGVLQRQGATQALPLSPSLVINWSDLVHTLEAGRTRIMLVDGSTLNVGARSTIKIRRHEPDKQQTEVELDSGKVRANIQKIIAPDGKFELYTKCAVIRTVDTSFLAAVEENATRACGVSGITEVRSSNFRITKTVRLLKNECTSVTCGLPPAEPAPSPAEMASLMSQTAINEGLSTAAIVGIAVGAAAGAGGIAAGIVISNSGPTTPTTP